MRFYRLGIIAAAALTLAACDKDPLNVDPTASLPAEEALKSAADVNLALRGVYDAVHTGNSDGTYSRNLIAFPDLYADNLRFTGTYTTDSEVALRNVTTYNGAVEGIWAAQYRVISRANNVLAGIPNAKDLSAADAARVRGEAHFLRALAYFDLVRWFGGVPIQTEPTWTVTDKSQAPRATQAEVYALIEKDLTEASGLLAASSTPTRATKGAADALLAKVYAEQGKWAQARDRAAAVIASGRYRLVESFADLFNVKNSPESIFELQYSTTDRNALSFWFFTRGQGGRWGFAPTDNLVAAFPAGDVRQGVSIGKDGSRLYGKKYFRIGNRDDNVIVVRLADMHLIRAEANARLGALAPVVTGDVNLVRNRAGLAGLPLTVLSQQQLLDAILDERRREFAFEGHRFFDLRRFGKAVDVLKIPASRLVFPIPQREIDVNKSLVQNPGY